jgi:hypothetical protein
MLPHQRPANPSAGADNSGFIRAAQRLRDTLSYVDRELGAGYADAHPSLIAALAQSAAIDACADSLGYMLDELRDTLRSALPQPSPGADALLGRELINEASGGLPKSALELRATLGRRKRHFRKVPVD